MVDPPENEAVTADNGDVVKEESPTNKEVEEKDTNSEPIANGDKDTSSVNVDKDKEDQTNKAAPQAQEEQEEPQQHNQQSEESDDLEAIKLSPLDADSQRQNLKDVLMNPATVLPPLASPTEEEDKEVGSTNNKNSQHNNSTLHHDEYSQYNDRQQYNPQNHESALGLGQPNNNNNNKKNTKARRKNRIVSNTTTEGGGNKKGHSHPRKTPYKSEIGRLRHAQKLEREAANKNNNKNDDTSSATSNTTGRSISIKETTAPPDSAFFSIQSAKFKHSLLHSLGEFLTGAFADDEEASGSYFSNDLLDQLSISNPHLKGVWLQAKSLNDTHVKQLCEALVRNKVVTEVWLPSNQITDVGAGYIAHMLKFNKTIKELFLGENNIGPKGASSLASALARGNTTLIALGLGDNHIGVEGAGAFAAALRHNHTLHTLDIKKNSIPKKSSIRALLTKMLEFNASDPGDESLVLGLQEELANLVSSLPPDMAENVVMQAEEALKTAMLCRKQGDKVGAAEAEGVFIRICTTGEAPQDPPEESDGSSSSNDNATTRKTSGNEKRGGPMDPDEETGDIKDNVDEEGKESSDDQQPSNEGNDTKQSSSEGDDTKQSNEEQVVDSEKDEASPSSS